MWSQLGIGLCRYNQVKWAHAGLELALNPMMGVLIRRERFRNRVSDAEERWHMKMEIGVEWWSYKLRNAKDCRKPQKIRWETWNGFSFKASEGAWLTPWFQASSLYICDRIKFPFFQTTQFVVICQGSLRKWIYYIICVEKHNCSVNGIVE